MDGLLGAGLGGLLIGIGAGAQLVVTGRCAGVSGMIDSAARPGGPAWRWAFLGGLTVGGLLLRALDPALVPGPVGSLPLLIVAGLVVGFGARVGGGCTSGHGIVGTSRLSPRSLVATATFMATGFATVAAVRALGG